MSAETSSQPVAVPTDSELPTARPDDAAIEEGKFVVAANIENGVNKAPLTNKTEDVNGSEKKHLPSEPTPHAENKLSTDAEGTGVDSQTELEVSASAVAGETPADPATATPASSSKSKARRKSAVIPEHKSKKLNRKASKAKISHSDAKPGDYYFIRLKGYPLWPGIVCDESMLPQSLISTRPVTAARPDGTYRADYEDGGKKVNDRTFPVMYLYTNEFGWIPNYDLVDLDLEEVGKVDQKMRKDLYQAHQLAAEKHELAFFKELLLEFQAQREAEAEAKAAAKAAKEASKSSGKNKKKSKASKDAEEEEVEDVDMVDVDGDLNVEGGASEKKPKSSKKRKALADPEESNTPQASSSTKKLKFKPITQSTPKAANGATPKSTSKKDPSAKVSKPKSKKSGANGVVEKIAAVPKEPELTPEEKRAKKEKEILFLRHKLQKGLLTRDQQPKEEEMKGMSEYISKLEGYADLEVSIIRATKINKVLKAILKLTEIPKESDFQFKDRSKSLLEKWNKILESAEQPAASATPAPVEEAASKELTNGISTAPKAEEDDGKDGENEKAKEPAVHAEVGSVVQDAAATEVQVNESKTAEDSIVPPAPELVAV